MRYPLHAWLLLLAPHRIDAGLDRIARAGLVEVVPTRWQIELGVLRMLHRIVFRSNTIGTCAHDPVRPTWRARVLANRVCRFPFLVAERAIAPWDLSGLLSSEERIIRHLLGAHHDGDQFVYDFQILALYPGALDRLRARAAAVVQGGTRRAAWLRDLTVYDRYHDYLLDAVDAFQAGSALSTTSASDPDITFSAWLAWCARQPSTPAATWRAWRAGHFHIQSGLVMA